MESGAHVEVVGTRQSRVTDHGASDRPANALPSKQPVEAAPVDVSLPEGTGAGVDREASAPAPEGRAEVARALYLSMVREVFALSAASSTARPHAESIDGAAVRANFDPLLREASRAQGGAGVTSWSRRGAPVPSGRRGRIAFVLWLFLRGYRVRS